MHGEQMNVKQLEKNLLLGDMMPAANVGVNT